MRPVEKVSSFRPKNVGIAVAATQADREFYCHDTAQENALHSPPFTRYPPQRHCHLPQFKIHPPVYLNSHLCPVLRVIPNSSLSSLTVNRPLCAKLINRCFCSIGNSFFQGITPSLCVTHVLGQFVTDLLGSYHRAAGPPSASRDVLDAG